MCSSGVRIQYRPRAAFRLLLVLCKLSEAPSRRRHDAFGGEVSVAGARPTAVLPRFIVCHVAGVTTPLSPTPRPADNRLRSQQTYLSGVGRRQGNGLSRSWRADFHRQNGRRRCGPVLATVRVRAAAGQVSIREVGMSGGLCHIVLRLVETDRTAPVQRCTDATLTGPSPPGGQPIDKTERAQPQPPGAAQSEPHIAAQKVLVKG